LSLDAEQAQAPLRRGAGRRALARITLIDACSNPAPAPSGLPPAAASGAAAASTTLGSFTDTPASEAISLVNGAGAQSYPIVNYEYAIVNTSQTSADRARDLRAFLSWAITSGAAQLARVRFQPLLSSVVTLSGAQIATIKGSYMTTRHAE